LPRLIDILPALAEEIVELLSKHKEHELAAQIAQLKIIDRCRCEDDFCATFYTQPKPRGSYGPNHRCVDLEPEHGYLILDVVADQIVAIEVLYRDEIRKTIQATIA
jgi:hypothetical protein